MVSETMSEGRSSERRMTSWVRQDAKQSPPQRMTSETHSSPRNDQTGQAIDGNAVRLRQLRRSNPGIGCNCRKYSLCPTIQLTLRQITERKTRDLVGKLR